MRLLGNAEVAKTTVLDSALLSAKIVKGATLKIYKGAPHGMCTTLKHQVNEDLLGFFKA